MGGEAAATASRDLERLEDYVRRVRSELVPEQRSGELLLAVFERAPWLLHWAFGLPAAQKFFVRYGRNETTLASFWGPRWVMSIVGLVFRIRR